MMPQYPLDLHALLQKYEWGFGDIPLGRPLDYRFKHIIEMEEGVHVVITTPYRNPKRYKYEIEKMIKELLEM